MPNTKISQDATVAYKATLLCPAVDMTLPAGSQNVNLPASILSGVSSGMRSVTTAATPLLAWNVLSASGILSNNPSIVFSPTANAPSTLGSLVVQVTTAATVTRQFAGHFGLTSNSGVGSSTADKVALYAATDGFAGSSNIWAGNTVTSMEAGFPATSAAQGIEIDFNNMAGARGTGVGVAGLIAQPLTSGLSISGASSYTSATGLFIGGTAGQWARGISIISCTTLSAISDYSSSTTGIEMVASHAGYGIDMNGSALGGAMRIPNNVAIRARNAAGTSDIDLVSLSTSNACNVGANATNIIANASILPKLDNTLFCGASGVRWASVWAVNGTIQTSDPSLKTDVEPLPPSLPIIMALKPVTFKWKVGGYDVVDDEPVERAGKRTHWGFLASNIKAAFAQSGRDYGGYIKDADGIEHNRPDQIIPALVKTIQELVERLEALEAAKAA